ncbi:MAG: hypothetical protein IPJ65_19775 [Archangiaceae bacterium]|nr:hypothetical protein [Archangiaceae bacterium]
MRSPLFVSLLMVAACLDLDPRGKWFAGEPPGLDGGSDGGDAGSEPDGGSGCACHLPAPYCDGRTRVSATTPACLDDAGCAFTLVRTTCPSGCTNGSCDGDPCLGVRCDMPPPATCPAAGVRRSFASPGTCQGGVCTYAASDFDCGSAGCSNGQCLADRCAGVTCNSPPAPICSTPNHVRTYGSVGTCNPSNGGCSYGSTDMACPDGCSNGACQVGLCVGVACSTPPAPTCLDAVTLRTWASPGSCNPMNGACSYAPIDSTCGSGCSGGQCLTNLCAGVTCNAPPAAACLDASTLRTWATPGTCNPSNGGCSYAPVDTACGAGGCANAQCQANLCAGVTCNNPPASSCVSTTTVRTYASSGTCSPSTGTCSYSSSTQTCSTGQQCQAGACVAVGCSASTCTGCCNGSTCVPFTSQTGSTCGASGAVCMACGGSSTCSSGVCRSAAPYWDTANASTRPTARTEQVMTYDTGAGAVVMFGGYDGSLAAFVNETWHFNPSTYSWTQKFPTASPAARAGPAMDFDAARGVTVLFGGSVNSTLSSETWTWSGTTWTLKSPTTRPTARQDHRMAYDSIRQRVVLFGGIDNSGARNDTWEWDGSTWQQRLPTNAPQSRSEHAMTFDTRTGHVLLFGGKASDGSWLSTTWEWDGTDWTQRSPAHVPPGRMRHTLSYDTVRQRAVLFGGYQSTAGYLADTWEFDGTDWVQMLSTGGPPARDNHSAAFAKGLVFIFGGYRSTSPNFLNDVWSWGP